MARLATEGCVIGIDLDEAMLDAARRRIQGTSLPIRFEKADARHLPFEAESFQGIRVDRVLHFIEDPQAVIHGLFRAGAPGCRIVIAEPDWNSLRIEGGDEPEA